MFCSARARNRHAYHRSDRIERQNDKKKIFKARKQVIRTYFYVEMPRADAFIRRENQIKRCFELRVKLSL